MNATEYIRRKIDGAIGESDYRHYAPYDYKVWHDRKRGCYSSNVAFKISEKLKRLTND